MCSGLSLSLCVPCLLSLFSKKVNFHFKSHQSVSLSMFVQLHYNGSLVIFRRYGMLRSFVVVKLQSKNKQSVSLPVFVSRHEHKDLNNSSVQLFFSEIQYVAFICVHERSLTTWNNAKIPTISTGIFSMPHQANSSTTSLQHFR